MDEEELQQNAYEKMGCAFTVLLVQWGVVVWLISAQLGFLKAVIASIIMSLIIWLLGIIGIIPVAGQWLYRRFAEGLIVWVFEVLRIDSNVSIAVPGWVAFLFRWGLETEMPSHPLSLASYTFHLGYIFTIIVSGAFLGAVMGNIVRAATAQKRIERLATKVLNDMQFDFTDHPWWWPCKESIMRNSPHFKADKEWGLTALAEQKN